MAINLIFRILHFFYNLFDWKKIKLERMLKANSHLNKINKLAFNNIC